MALGVRDFYHFPIALTLKRGNVSLSFLKNCAGEEVEWEKKIIKQKIE